MSIQEIVEILVNSGIEPNEANIEVKMMIEHFCNYGAKDILMGKKLDEKSLKIVKEKAKLRAKTRMPIQYIIGQAYFMGSYYEVNQNVLIPRDETELAVRKAVHVINEKLYTNALDMGTGTGCIACSIAKFSKCHVDAVDVSNKALDVAKYNAYALGMKSVDFILSDLYENLDGKKYDIIVSNPPYVELGYVLQRELEYEPSVALFAGGEAGTEFYEKILSKAPNHLNDGGMVIFEIGRGQDELVKSYFEKYGFSDIEVQNDLAGIPRVMSGTLVVG